jgi:hypothetical protein
MSAVGMLVIEPLERFRDRMLIFLPNILAFVLIFVVGLTLAWILKRTFLNVFRYVRLDKYAERVGIVPLLAKSGIRETPSFLLSRIIGWSVLIIFLIIALHSLDIPAVESILTRLLLYVPHIFVAASILLLGYLLGTFFGRAALIASVNAGIKVAGLIGKFVKFAVLILSTTMALEQLGIARETVLVAFAITFGGFVLASAIAFGVGGRDLAKEILEKKVRGEKPTDDICHL